MTFICRLLRGSRSRRSPLRTLAFTLPVILGVLVAVPWPWPGEMKYGTDAISRVWGPTEANLPISTDKYDRSTVHFDSQGEKLEAWLYIPKVQMEQQEVAASGSRKADQEEEGKDQQQAAAPATSERVAASESGHRCIILAHGMGGQKDFGLHHYADAFASNGYAALVFDFRGFGGSDGEPRNLVSPKRHVEDYVAAIHAVQPDGPLASHGLNCTSLALWGTSFSGGHVLVAATKVPFTVNAIISQVPHLSGPEVRRTSLEKRGLLGVLRFGVAGVHDLLRSKLGMPAGYVKLVGSPGELAFMQLSLAEQHQYHSRHPKKKLGGWTPWVPARLILEVSRYSPMLSLPEVQAPVLFISASKDHLCPPGIIRQVAASCTTCEHREYNAGHFALYTGAISEEIKREMVDFLKKHM